MRLLLLVSILTLCACAGQATLPTAWARTDGHAVNSELLDIDTLDCKDGIQKSDGMDSGKLAMGGPSRAMVDDFVSCMREHGYVQIKS